MNKDRRTRWRVLFEAMLMLWAGLALAAALAGCDTDPPPMNTSTTHPPAAPVYQGTIVAVGDSLTAGLGVAEEDAYPAQLARKLQADGYAFNVINAGVSGETSSGTLSRIAWVISSLRPDIVILETGANDGLRGLDPKLLKRNLDKVVTILKANDIQVILAGMRMLPNLGPEYTRAFTTIYPQVSRKHGLDFIPFFLEGVAGVSRYNQADKIHPTAQGYHILVEHIYNHVVRAAEKHLAHKKQGQL